jgi:hypothetical protein
MSIATLKKKSAARYFPHSVAGVGFSLNGVTRFLGAGDTSLGRSVTRTPFRGNLPMGHGGGTRCRVSGIKGRAARCDSNNEYPIHIIRSGEQVPQTLVKRSTMSAVPYRELKNMNFLNKEGCHWVKANGLAESELTRYCIKKAEIKPCKSADPSGCKSSAIPLHTKDAPAPERYEIFYMKKRFETERCAKPKWPPRVLNASCTPSVQITYN